MAFFQDALQWIRQIYAVFAHFGALLIHLCCSNIPEPELPIIAPLPTETGAPTHNIGAATQGDLILSFVHALCN